MTTTPDNVLTDETLVAILRRVVMEPDVDLHRLVYADRLDELGEHERAEYVRTAVTEDLADPVWLSYGKPGSGEIIIWMQYDRGFPAEIKCDAATFLLYADDLVWHETQTMECPECKGRGGVSDPGMTGAHEWFKCYACNNGRVPRPCPPTAQPIRKAVLTTDLRDHDVELRRVLRVEDGLYVWRCYKWPGVEFELSAADGDLLNNASPGETFGTDAASDDNSVGGPNEHLSYP